MPLDEDTVRLATGKNRATVVPPMPSGPHGRVILKIAADQVNTPRSPYSCESATSSSNRRQMSIAWSYRSTACAKSPRALYADPMRRKHSARAGPSLSAVTLAVLLQRAGAVRAMELDINPDWTTAYYFTPAGTCIHKVGIRPDIDVEIPSMTDEELKVYRDERERTFQESTEPVSSNKKDPFMKISKYDTQLKTAVDVLHDSLTAYESVLKEKNSLPAHIATSALHR